jgi:hypothetical protein
MEGFAQGIVEVNDAVGLAQDSQVYQTPILQQLSMRLHTQIFACLCNFMRWYLDRSRKRFLNSFNENIARIFEDDLAQVRKLSDLLSAQIHRHMSADIRVSKLMKEEMTGGLKYLIKLAEAEEKQSQLRDRVVGEFLQDILHQQLSQSKEEITHSLQGIMKAWMENLQRQIPGRGSQAY